MIITEFDAPLAAEDARKISLNNRDDSVDRSHFRELMAKIKYGASFGHTRLSTSGCPQCREYFYSENVQNALRALGYRVIEKRAYAWDSEAKDFSKSKPHLDHSGRETFFLEITWG